MDNINAIRSLNLIGGDVLTLEKAKDRLEFEALPVMGAGMDKCLFLKTVCDDYCVTKTSCGSKGDPCPSDTQTPCGEYRPGCPSYNVG